MPTSPQELIQYLQERQINWDICFLKHKKTIFYFINNGILDPERMCAVIAKIFIDYFEFASVTISENTVATLSRMIVEDYYFLTVWDIWLFAKMLKKNEFSKCYGAVTAPQIFTWLKEYIAKRNNAFFDIIEKKETERITGSSATTGKLLCSGQRPQVERYAGSDNNDKRIGKIKRIGDLIK